MPIIFMQHSIYSVELGTISRISDDENSLVGDGCAKGMALLLFVCANYFIASTPV